MKQPQLTTALFQRALFALSLCALFACSSSPHDTDLRQTVYVGNASCSGSPCFESIQAALDSAASDDGLLVIKLEEGTYYEKVNLTRDDVVIEGVGASKSVLEFDAYNAIAKHYHPSGSGTSGSATLTITGSDIALRHLTIKNSFDFLASDALPKGHPEKVRGTQAVALLIDYGADRVELDHVHLEGYQDTLYAKAGRSWVHDSTISGNVDFIFGAGALLIENSDIIARRRAGQGASSGLWGYLTAPSTNIAQPYGIVIAHSRLVREAEVPDHSYTLGRPWHPTTTFDDGRYADPNAIGQALIMDSYIDAHIHPDRWSSMNGTARDGSKSRVFTPEESRFVEARNHGPGALSETATEWQKVNLEAIRKIMFGDWQPK